MEIHVKTKTHTFRITNREKERSFFLIIVQFSAKIKKYKDVQRKQSPIQSVSRNYTETNTHLNFLLYLEQVRSTNVYFRACNEKGSKHCNYSNSLEQAFESAA